MAKVNEISNQQPIQWKDIVQQQVTESLGQVNDNIQIVQTTLEETRAQAAEQRDKESHRNNIIIYSVPESDEARAENRNKADVDFCMLLFNNVLHTGMVEDDITNVFRLGKRNSDTRRPLMVQLASYTFKNLIMENLYRWKHAEEKFKHVVIAHDTTKIERTECKRVVEEAKSLAAEDRSGEYLYRVRGPQGT